MDATVLLVCLVFCFTIGKPPFARYASILPHIARIVKHIFKHTILKKNCRKEDETLEIPIVPQKLTYTVVEAAAALGVSKSVMYQLIRTDGFPVISIGNKRLIPIESFKRWTEERAAAGWCFN